MKTKVQAVVVRNKTTQEIFDVYPIGNSYNETYIVYPAGHVSLEEIKQYATKVYGSNADKTMATQISAVAFGNDFYLQWEAKDLPSLGNVQVKIETKEIEWE